MSAHALSNLRVEEDQSTSVRTGEAKKAIEEEGIRAKLLGL